MTSTRKTYNVRLTNRDGIEIVTFRFKAETTEEKEKVIIIITTGIKSGAEFFSITDDSGTKVIRTSNIGMIHFPPVGP